jgi:hypothetical protein
VDGALLSYYRKSFQVSSSVCRPKLFLFSALADNRCK